MIRNFVNLIASSKMKINAFMLHATLLKTWQNSCINRCSDIAFQLVQRKALLVEEIINYHLRITTLFFQMMDISELYETMPSCPSFWTNEMAARGSANIAERPSQKRKIGQNCNQELKFALLLNIFVIKPKPGLKPLCWCLCIWFWLLVEISPVLMNIWECQQQS